MKKFYILIIISLAFNISAFAQTPSMTLQTVNDGLPCHYVNITITAANFPDTIGSVILRINIDANVVQYLGKINGTISPSVNQSAGSQIIIQWNIGGDTNGISINGLLLTLHLHYDGGSAVLDWDDPNCEITKAYDPYPVVNFDKINGAVNEGTYTFNTYYVDKNRPEGGDGLSWASAFNQLSDVNTLLLKPGEQVLIKPETYNEKFVIRSNAGYAVRPTHGVILSDTNKITFPGGANFSCVDLGLYPDQYYAYVYRSWNSNNGYYKVIEVNDAENYVRVAGASFIPETGVANNRGKVTAAVGRPVIYKKDPAASESQRVIINDLSATSVPPADALYIGSFIGTGQTDADSANWNIIEGIDINNTVSNMKGLHIQCSKYNVYAKGKIYCSAGTGGTGVIITGSGSKRSYYNIIQNNEIYNTPNQGVFIGYPSSTTSSNNYAYFNHILDNNIYLTTGTLAKFNNAIRIQNFNKINVIEGNNIHDMKILTGGNGALYIGTYVDSTLIYSNILKNIGKEAANSGINACIMIDSINNKVHAFNNIIYNYPSVSDAVYAFRINGRSHAGSKVCYNTIYQVNNAFYLKDNVASSIDFGIHNNIINPTSGYFTNIGTSGRFAVTYNLFRLSPGAPYYPGTGNIVGDPLFIDPSGSTIYGLILNGSSPAMDAGIPVTNITTDYFGEFRDNATPTMGAFENTMTCTWTGAINTDWHNYQNWLFQYVPQNDMTVVIPNVTNDPVISLNNVVCKSVTLSTGASIRVVSPRTLTLSD